MITQQMQLMQDMAQHRQESNDTDQIKSEPGDAQKQLHANTTNGHGLTEDKEIAGALNSEGG